VPLFIIIRILVIPVIGSGIRSNSRFAQLGAYRSVSQSISYEVVLVFVIISVIIYYHNLSLVGTDILPTTAGDRIAPSILLLWVTIWIRERNRPPFDFRERERELVSGFNVEYRGGLFALLVICEYGAILFMAAIGCDLFIGGSSSLYLIIPVIGVVVAWVRISLPRYRYDQIIILC